MRWGPLLAVVFAGCASIHISESVTDTSLRPRVRESVVDDSLEYALTTTVRAERLMLEVEQSETCATITKERSHRVTAVTRTAESTVVRTTWTIATVAVGLAAYSYANAEGLASDANARNMDSASTAQEYREYAGGLAVVGLAAATVGVIDALRATDYQRDDGVIMGVSRREESTCRERKSRQKDVVLVLANGHELSARTDQDGRAEFTLLTVPETGIPEDDTIVAASIAGARVTVKLSPDQRQELRAALVANPRSQLAIDLLEKRRLACARIAAAAQAVARTEVDDAPDEVHRAWLTAKSSCGDLWTPALDVELADVERRIGLARCNQRLVRAAVAVASDAAAESLESIESELVDVRALCTSALHLQQLRQLDTRLAVIVKRIAREEAEAVRQAAREESRVLKEAKRKQRQRVPQRSRGSGMLRCNDGTLSPTCTCGRSSNRGCCSWHGGVSGCDSSD